MLQESCAQPEVTILHHVGGPSFAEELRHCYVYFLSRNQDTASRPYHHLIAPSLFSVSPPFQDQQMFESALWGCSVLIQGTGQL